ncbi:Ig-like domain-containing protein [Mesobacillus jeotgali]|uniref:Ig-like domain-containing protein n=1 Tax=Mesobacillus jeotgali TaxID=129985 RepID=A0ABY9VFH4_9BACI|nr:Ig-like domain-containing protein [Mesobacillus jeotgali]WNF22676.1 Ig-like domain-containing protein [Mesobacillus jeotgali]
MTKKYIILCLSFFLILLIGNSAFAEEPNEIVVKEIGSNYILGTYLGEDTISVFSGEYLLGQGKAVNNTLKINFSQQISGNSKLTLKAESTGVTTDTVYTPAVLNKIEDKRKVVSGQTVPGATITASANGKGLSLKRFNKADGTFEFKPSPLLKYKSTVKVVALIDGIKNVGSAQVIASAAPSKPKVNTVTNKTNYISGYAEPYSEVNIMIGKSRYTVRAYSTGYFKRYLPNKKPLSAGTVVSVYATADRYKSKSGIVTVKVADKIPPAAPRVNKKPISRL